MSETQSTGSAEAAGKASTAAGAEAVSGKPSGKAGDFSAATPISSMADLKEKAPELYKKMMQGLAQNIIGRMRDAQKRLKESMRKNRDP
jgi:hypothetical protein